MMFCIARLSTYLLKEDKYRKLFAENLQGLIQYFSDFLEKSDLLKDLLVVIDYLTSNQKMP